MSSCQGLPHPGGTLGTLTSWTLDRGPRKAHHTEIRHLAENLGVKRWGLSFVPTWLWACWLPDLHPDLRKVSFIGLGLKKHSVGSSAKVTHLETLHHSRLAPPPLRTSTMSWGSYSKTSKKKTASEREGEKQQKIIRRLRTNLRRRDKPQINRQMTPAGRRSWTLGSGMLFLNLFSKLKIA